MAQWCGLFIDMSEAGGLCPLKVILSFSRLYRPHMTMLWMTEGRLSCLQQHYGIDCLHTCTTLQLFYHSTSVDTIDNLCTCTTPQLFYHSTSVDTIDNLYTCTTLQLFYQLMIDYNGVITSVVCVQLSSTDLAAPHNCWLLLLDRVGTQSTHCCTFHGV